MYLMKFAEAMIADQAKAAEGAAVASSSQDQVDGSVLERLYAGTQTPSPTPKSLPQIPCIHQRTRESRDRANSIDGQILRSLISMRTGDTSSTSSVSPHLSRTPSETAATLASPSNTGFVQQGSNANAPSSRTHGMLLYSLLVNGDSGEPLIIPRLKQPASSDLDASNEAKRHRLEGPGQSNEHSMPAAINFHSPTPIVPVGHRRFSFGGYPSSRPERLSAMMRPIGVERHRIEEEARMSVRTASLSASTMSSGAPSCSNSNPSILSALISSADAMPSPVISTSSDSGMDEPLDLTGQRKSATSVMQLAKKTARPLQSRMTDLIKQAGEFLLKYKQAETSWIAVFRNCWHRLVVLGMVENGLNFVVVQSTHTSEHLFGEGEQILPWLLSAAHPVAWTPTQEFTDQITECIHDLVQQKLSADEVEMLRHAVLLTAEKPSALASVGVQIVRTSRLSSDPVHNGTTTEAPDNLDLAGVERSLMRLARISRYQVAGLFCTHLKGETTMSELVPLEVRAPQPPVPSRPIPDAEPMSILGSLISDQSEWQ